MCEMSHDRMSHRSETPAFHVSPGCERLRKGTVYRQFPSKEDLFLAAVDQGMQQLKTVIDLAAGQAGTAIERVELGVKAYLEYFDQHPDVTELDDSRAVELS